MVIKLLRWFIQMEILLKANVHYRRRRTPGPRDPAWMKCPFLHPPYIKAPPPTPLHVKVHKHPKWNKTPYPINRSQNTSPQLPNFSHKTNTKNSHHNIAITQTNHLHPLKNSLKTYGNL
jgi:hypothetical protein